MAMVPNGTLCAARTTLSKAARFRGNRGVQGLHDRDPDR
jgi:hypothetical protein